MTWYHRGVPLTARPGHIHVDYGDGYSTLSVAGIESTESGKYEVVVENVAGSAKLKFDVIVRCTPISYRFNHLGSKKLLRPQSSKICYLFNVNCIHFKIVRERIEVTHQRWVGRSESRRYMYWTCCWRVASTSTSLRSCWRMTFWADAVIKMMRSHTCEFLSDSYPYRQSCLSLFG